MKIQQNTNQQPSFSAIVLYNRPLNERVAKLLGVASVPAQYSGKSAGVILHNLKVMIEEANSITSLQKKVKKTSASVSTTFRLGNDKVTLDRYPKKPVDDNISIKHGRTGAQGLTEILSYGVADNDFNDLAKVIDELA